MAWKGLYFFTTAFAVDEEPLHCMLAICTWYEHRICCLCRSSTQQRHPSSSHTSDLNPFADDNFGSLSAEDIVAQQFDQLQTSNKRP